MTKMYNNRLVEYNTKLVNVHKLHKIQEARPKGISTYLKDSHASPAPNAVAVRTSSINLLQALQFVTNYSPSFEIILNERRCNLYRNYCQLNKQYFNTTRTDLYTRALIKLLWVI